MGEAASTRMARHGAVWVEFEDASRIASFHWSDVDAVGLDAANALVPQVAAWTATFQGPYGFLVDGSTSFGTAPEGEAWFQRWAAFQREEPGRGRVAIFRPNRFTRGRLLRYNHLADTTLRLFDDEHDARQWLAHEIGTR